MPMKEMQEMGVRSQGREDSLGEEMATHSSILAWKFHGQTNPTSMGVPPQEGLEWLLSEVVLTLVILHCRWILYH